MNAYHLELYVSKVLFCYLFHYVCLLSKFSLVPKVRFPKVLYSINGFREKFVYIFCSRLRCWKYDNVQSQLHLIDRFRLDSWALSDMDQSIVSVKHHHCYGCAIVGKLAFRSGNKLSLVQLRLCKMNSYKTSQNLRKTENPV